MTVVDQSIFKMRIAYYSSDYSTCSLTDLQSFKYCQEDDDHSLAIRMFELMFEPIKFIGFRKPKENTNETDEDEYVGLTKAMTNGTVDGFITKRYLTVSRTNATTFATPFYEGHYVIAMNRDMVEFGSVDESDYIVTPFSKGLWMIFGILLFICFLFKSKTTKFFSVKIVSLTICILQAVLCAAYNASMKVDFVKMTVPKTPYKSLEELAEGLNNNKIDLLTGNSHKMIINQFEDSNKSNWQQLKNALKLRPIVGVGIQMESKCNKIINEYFESETHFVMLDTDNNLRNLCKQTLKLMDVAELDEEPAPLGAYIFRKHSIYGEKVSRIAQFLAVEHIRKGRKYQMLPVLPRILPQNLGTLKVFDMRKCFLYYAISLVAVAGVFAVELIMKKMNIEYFKLKLVMLKIINV